MIINSLRENRKPYGGNDLLTEFDIPIEELVPGMICPTCQTPTMKEKFNSWMCEQCYTFDGNAHIDTLVDYCFIIDQYISVAQAQWFMQISSISLTHQLLTNLKLPQVETEKGLMYDLSPLITSNFMTKKEVKSALAELFK